MRAKKSVKNLKTKEEMYHKKRVTRCRAKNPQVILAWTHRKQLQLLGVMKESPF